MRFRSLQAPLTPEQLRPLEPELTRLQFSQGLTDDEYRALAALLADRPDVTLRAYGGYGRTLPDLEWLRFFPGLRRVSIDALWGVLRSLDGLRHLPDDLEELGLGKLKAPLDVRVLTRFRLLRQLGLEGPVRHPEAISGFTRLEGLLLRSVTLPDLSSLLPMAGLRRLDLKLGGTSDLRLLPRVGTLEELEIWRVRGLDDVSSVGDVRSLRTLWLEALPQVRSLPDLSEMTNLRKVTLHTMKGLRDLSPLSTAPALEDLALIAMPHLEPGDLRPLAGHPSLRRGHWNIGSLRKTYEAHDVVSVAPEPFGYGEWRAGVPYRDLRSAFTDALRVGLVEVDGRMVVDPSRLAGGSSS
jgi:hypothetical protein